MTGEPLKIVILGGGTAGWMAANLFARKWAEASVAIELVESPDIGIIGVGEGSTPTLKRFFELVDVADAEWMPACNATYKLSIRFAGWDGDVLLFAFGVGKAEIDKLDLVTLDHFQNFCRHLVPPKVPN